MSGENKQENKQKARQLAFWDIESLSNIFMFAVYAPESEFFGNGGKDLLIYFYLFDGMALDDGLKDRILARVFQKNKQLDPLNTDVRFMDLKQESTNRLLVGLFSVDDKRAFGKPDENRFIRINSRIRSDLDGDPSFPYFLGYNTANYDDIMMAMYFNETWGFSPQGGTPSFDPTTAAHMRSLNNQMFSRYKADMRAILREGSEKNIYENMLRTGLFVDVAKVNDKVYKMPLKRIMGMMGMDIFEDGNISNEKPVTDPDEIADLFAYNASDDIKLSVMFEHRAFKAQFQLKKGLMDSYPDILYKKDEKTGKTEVRINRMKCDDTSAKFAQRVLCPDGWLPDIRAVSFEYPKGSGRNVLVETRQWVQDKFGKFGPDGPLKYIMPVLDWYGAIEGNNFDSSEHYEQTYLFDGLDPIKISSIPQPQTSIPYFNADGTPSRTYVNFGIGGIHGAEYDKDAYDADVREFNKRVAEIRSFLSHFTEGQLQDLKPTVVIDGVKYKRSDYLTIAKDGTIKIKWPKPVELFTCDKKSGKWNLNKKYAYTSDDIVEHEDFTSYYPCMLMNLKAYVNAALGEDRYVQQFENKGKYGKLMKDKSLSEEDKSFYATLREGTKLILNSASGASDTEYDNPIRMNNVIISMRLIGQMFTYRIGQAQTLEGFKITSTNTDGLYAAVTDETRQLCRDILAREAADINVDIEPESMRLVSKDANNRIEISLDDKKILSASGGDVACWKGPVPNKALSHPALIDRLMVDYLLRYGVTEPFSITRAAGVLGRVKSELSPTDLLMLYQQIINSSEGSVRYIFGVVNGEVRTFQHNNRIFAIRPEGAHLYMANGWNKGIGHDETADKVLAAYGVDPAQFSNTRVMKISRIDPDQNMFIYNRALDDLDPATAKGLIASLDDGYYIDMLQRTYNNWSRVKSGSNSDPGLDEGDEA